ncbi:protein kinase [Streptomyces sp. NPDC060000]|uniref:protein kinase n=1 Tax=Streptomyces sp. NPDC060000 TaxID=3347031 RepID=UPI00368C3945
MDDYAGRVLVDRYRLPLPPSDEYELTETRAFDTYSGQEVLVRQVPLPEVVEAEVLDAEGLPEGFQARESGARRPRTRGVGAGEGTRRPADPVVRRAMEAAQATASIPDHPRLDQVFDVFAESGSLWIVSELVAARPLAALLAEKPLTPYRAAEVASDVLMALRVLHAHGWVHRNITARTVLVCDDGRVMLTGLAVGAAEEALCGYDPVPTEDPAAGTRGVTDSPRGSTGPLQPDGPGALGGPESSSGPGPGVSGGPVGPGGGGSAGFGAPQGVGGPGGSGGSGGIEGFGGFGGSVGIGSGGDGLGSGGDGLGGGAVDPEAARRAAIEARGSGALPVPSGEPSGGGGTVARRAPMDTGGDIRAARAGAIAAYRAGARAAARVQEAQEAQQNGRAALPGARNPADGGHGTGGGNPPGQIADPYGVSGAPLPGAPMSGPAGYGQGSSAHVHSIGPGSVGSPQASAPAPHASLTPAPGAQIPVQGQGQGQRWGESADGVSGSAVRRGPATALAAERARQARMAVVGPVTERWAPEQAGPVHENWQLAAPIGPATDLWALGALLFRAVQGHAPYPEESTAELVQLVCAEPPAFAEECGPLRPVVESLLRQDPTERLDFEELRGWLRSLVRSAPEPEAGTYVVAAPPTDPRRLPIVRRRGELVRRRRAGLPATHGRHKRGRPETDRSPRSLGRTLLVLILLVLAAAIAYALMFMPKSGEEDAAGTDGSRRTGATGVPDGQAPDASSAPRPDQTSPGTGSSAATASSAAEATQTQTGGSGTGVADGFTVRADEAGFKVAVANGWDRSPKNGRGQVVYAHGDFELIVVPGRDSASSNGSDPMAYQREKESELQPYRDSSWATASGLRTTTVGSRTMAEGQFTWTDGGGQELYVRNVAILISGRYHIVQVRGPEAERDEVTRLFEQASATYQYTG